MSEWMEMLARIHARSKTVKIALCGKYVQLHDAYLSVAEALAHGGYENDAKVEIDWVDTESLTRDNVAEKLGDADGIIIPGGFGNRGIEGMVLAAQYARENNVPYFGICLGMQIAAIEFARNVLGYADANSSEFEPESKHHVIDLMPDQYGVKLGGTMRLGAYPCKVIGPIMKRAYGGQEEVAERHRHRFEFNNDYRKQFEENGMMIAGTSPDGHLCEAIEYPADDFYIGVQFHPEFKSRPNAAQPIFREFIKSAVRYMEKKRGAAAE